MKKYLFCAALIVCALILLSGVERPYNTYRTEVTAHTDDVLDALIEPYYDKCTHRVYWQEYRYRHRELNKALFKNGRALQPGDKVKIEFYVCK